MLIIPAIDLYEGKAVRLTKGDFSRMTVYFDDPLAAAIAFKEAGARRLHVVDLEAAKTGEQRNLHIIRAIAKIEGMRIQAGGGARDAASVDRYMNAGADAVIIGSAAVTDPGFLEKIAARYPGRIAAGVDAKGGYMSIHGWSETAGIRALDFLRGLPGLGVNMAVYTDIDRDGLLEGANIDAYREAGEIAGLKLIASGGVSSEEDILALNALNIYGAIIGKAYYERKIDLARVIALTEGCKDA